MNFPCDENEIFCVFKNNLSKLFLIKMHHWNTKSFRSLIIHHYEVYLEINIPRLIACSCTFHSESHILYYDNGSLASYGLKCKDKKKVKTISIRWNLLFCRDQLPDVNINRYYIPDNTKQQPSILNNYFMLIEVREYHYFNK